VKFEAKGIYGYAITKKLEMPMLQFSQKRLTLPRFGEHMAVKAVKDTKLTFPRLFSKKNLTV
jgi:hypothetical protein